MKHEGTNKTLYTLRKWDTQWETWITYLKDIFFPSITILFDWICSMSVNVAETNSSILHRFSSTEFSKRVLFGNTNPWQEVSINIFISYQYKRKLKTHLVDTCSDLQFYLATTLLVLRSCILLQMIYFLQFLHHRRRNADWQ